MFRLVARLLYICLLIIETFVAVRIVFKFIGGNGDSSIVKFFYDISDIFVNPFNGIITSQIKLANFTIDTTAILALIVYMILAFIAIELVRAFSHAEG